MRQLLLVLCAIPGFVFGQETEFFNEKDVFYKDYCWYHKSDSTKVTGVIKRFRKNGVVEKEVYAVDGLLNGEARSWYDNGVLYEVGNFNSSKVDGEVRGWHRNGQLAARGTTRDGQKTGTYQKWYENGSLEEEKNYVNGKEEGSQKVYHYNGHLKSETNYVNGKLEGWQRVYHPNGQLKSETNYVEGEKERETIYYADGNIITLTDKVEDDFDGLHKEYYHNGLLWSESNFVHGELVDGTEYFPDGKLKIEVKFELGEMLFKREWYGTHSGQPHVLMNEGKREGDVWTYKTWYRDGTLMEVSHTNNKGESIGVYQRFYANGVLKYERNYDDNGKFISSKSWDINGNLMD
ncbi:toxin-antitoxin system YwqK family antitoxin [Aestuariivivens sediminicola]|uniref:toxin-antitoxin system YwqK family antitoxin n=1 Tax=Aestuariivivens sediminicola TaxID=2913560 RepID=UPI001F57B3A8|nr:toxin-antitoxin system YwqK family antitoxin [Aestuariivivens sediminicola]